jgi:hypothetical protein
LELFAMGYKSSAPRCAHGVSILINMMLSSLVG